MLSRSITQVGKWARRIASGALVLALAGLSAPATTSAAIMEQDGETIEVESDAPVIPPWWHGGYTGGGSSSGGSGGGGGGGGGGGSSSGGGGTSTQAQVIQRRLADLERKCTDFGGTWREEVFEDFQDADLVHLGYVCITRPTSDGQREWTYYDSEGTYNHVCVGDSEVRICAIDY